MNITVTTSPAAREELAKTMGGELGITFFVRGIRVFIPESAGADDVQETIDVLTRLNESNLPSNRLKT